MAFGRLEATHLLNGNNLSAICLTFREGLKKYMTLPKRKSNRLEEYDYNQNGYYFITICSKDKMNIFGKVVGGSALDAPKIQLSEIGKIVEKHIKTSNNIEYLTIDKYVIMPNHIHIIFVVNGGQSKAPAPTNSIISHSVSTFKRFVNKEIGHNVFQRSFYDHIIRNKEDYLNIWNYIDVNPQKWAEDKYFVE